MTCISNNNNNNNNITEHVPSNTLVYDIKDDSRFSNANNFNYQIFPTTVNPFSDHFVIEDDPETRARLLPNGELRTRGVFDCEQMFTAVGGI